MSFAQQALAILVLLGGLVFFHELGHFVAAKLFNVKVLKFSLGFGPRLWGFTRGETEYQLAALPLGGFVRMAGEIPGDELSPEDRGRGFADQPPHRRAIISLAGPAVNLVLPVLVFAIVNLVPRHEIPAVVGLVIANEPAERAGLQPGDRVVSLDGVPTRSFEEMKEAIEARPAQTVPMIVERAGQMVTLTITPSSETLTNPIETTKKGKIGVVPGKLPSYVGVVAGSRAAEAGVQNFDRVVSVNGAPVATPAELKHALEKAADGAVKLELLRAQAIPSRTAGVATEEKLAIEVPAGTGALGLEWPDRHVRTVKEGSPAWKAGLRPGDKIVTFGGQPVASLVRYDYLRRDAREEGRKALELGVERGGQRLDVIFQPAMVERMDQNMGKVTEPDDGFAFDHRVFIGEPFTDAEMPLISYGVGEAFQRGFSKTVEVTRGMIIGIAGLFTARIPLESVGGPLMIGKLATQAAEGGISRFLELFALISINLGLVNLLPIPVLDGFHILVSTVEGVSRRRVPMRFREVANYVGFAMLLALMVLAMRNDIVKHFAN